jgi:plasmid maintenance system antidote protein VapI
MLPEVGDFADQLEAPDLRSQMALRIEKAFGVKMETLLNMQAWRDAHAMRQREGEIALKPYRPSAPEPR